VVTRALTGNAPVGSGQAELKIYSDLYFVVEIPGLLSCQNDSDCPTGQTCQVPGQMCGISCTSNADCPSGQTCLATTNICQ
jgi:Cys-rich repeat protein